MVDLSNASVSPAHSSGPKRACGLFLPNLPSLHFVLPSSWTLPSFRHGGLFPKPWTRPALPSELCGQVPPFDQPPMPPFQVTVGRGRCSFLVPPRPVPPGIVWVRQGGTSRTFRGKGGGRVWWSGWISNPRLRSPLGDPVRQKSEVQSHQTNTCAQEHIEREEPEVRVCRKSSQEQVRQPGCDRCEPKAVHKGEGRPRERERVWWDESVTCEAEVLSGASERFNDGARSAESG